MPDVNQIRFAFALLMSAYQLEAFKLPKELSRLVVTTFEFVTNLAIGEVDYYSPVIVGQTILFGQ